MKTLPLLALAVVLGLSGCIETMENAARSAAEIAETCGSHEREHDQDTLLPVAITDDGSFDVPGAVSILVMSANVSATTPGMARVEVRDPSDYVVYRLEVGPGGTSAQGSKEMLGPDPGRYTVWAEGTPDGAYSLQVFAAGCGADDHDHDDA